MKNLVKSLILASTVLSSPAMDVPTDYGILGKDCLSIVIQKADSPTSLAIAECSKGCLALFRENRRHIKVKEGISGLRFLAGVYSLASQTRKHLESLDLSVCKFPDFIIMKALACFPNLKSLTISNGELSNDNIKKIASQFGKQLLELNLKDFYWLDPDALEHICKNAPNLRAFSFPRGFVKSKEWPLGFFGVSFTFAHVESLALEGPHRFPETSLPIVLKKFPRITSLSLSRCNHLRNEEITHLAASCPLVTHLNLSRCPWLTDRHLKNILSEFKNLVSLDLMNCPTITDAGFTNLKGAYPKLRTLILKRINTDFTSVLKHELNYRLYEPSPSIFSCFKSALGYWFQPTEPQITDVGVSAIFEKFPNLRHLDMENSYEITGAPFEKYASNQLTYVNLRGCFRVPDEALEELKGAFIEREG